MDRDIDNQVTCGVFLCVVIHHGLGYMVTFRPFGYFIAV
jgi:hypothetical protein